MDEHKTHIRPLGGAQHPGMPGGDPLRLGSPIEQYPGQCKKIMRKPGTSVVVWIIDKSNSMNVYGTTPEDSVDKGNRLILTSGHGYNHVVAVIALAGNHEVVLQLQPTEIAPEIDLGSFHFRKDEGTRLWATVHEVLCFLLGSFAYDPRLGQPEQDLRVSINVLTDGSDTCSNVYLQESRYPGSLKRTTSLCQANGWTLQVRRIGGVPNTKIDAKVVAEEMGFDPKYAQNVETNKKGIETGVADMADTTLRNTLAPEDSDGNTKIPDF